MINIQIWPPPSKVRLLSISQYFNTTKHPKIRVKHAVQCVQNECNNLITSIFDINQPGYQSNTRCNNIIKPKTGAAERKIEKEREQTQTVTCLLQHNCITKQDVHVVFPVDALFLSAHLNSYITFCICTCSGLAARNSFIHYFSDNIGSSTGCVHCVSSTSQSYLEENKCSWCGIYSKKVLFKKLEMTCSFSLITKERAFWRNKKRAATSNMYCMVTIVTMIALVYRNWLKVTLKLRKGFSFMKELMTTWPLIPLISTISAISSYRGDFFFQTIPVFLVTGLC